MMSKRNNKTGLRERIIQTLKLMEEQAELIAEGDRVRLNVSQIKEHPDYKAKTKEYKKFIESAESRVFTAHLHRLPREGFSALVELNEEPKWLFWEGDLIKVSEESGAVD